VFDDLPAADGHAIRVRFGCSLRAADDNADRQMLAMQLLAGRASVTGAWKPGCPGPRTTHCRRR
jgi:hypothetical protein